MIYLLKICFAERTAEIMKEKTKEKMNKQPKREAAHAALKDKMGMKTTIKARILRLSVLSIIVCTIVYVGLSLILMYSQVNSAANDEVDMLAISYASSISNADLDKATNLLSDLFVDFESQNSYGGTGFVITKSGSIISETACPFGQKGDDLYTLTVENPEYAGLSPIFTGIKATAMTEESVPNGHRVVTVKNVKYLIGWTQIEKYQELYTMIVFPYDSVFKPFVNNAIFSALVAAALITAGIIVSTSVSVKITKPITAATERLKGLSRGDLASPSPTTMRNDETLVLLTSLSDTIGLLNEYIGDIRTVLSGVASGNLMITSNAEYAGDFSEIKLALDRIITSLNGTFGEVHKAALSVKDCSASVSDGTAALSKNASVEADTMQQLTAAMADMSDKISRNADEAQQARTITTSADEVALKGSENMRQMISAINDIETSSAEIGEIINVIDDIAFQTNILALNAAVEAARAGEAGKGFAVVADEVRNLATKSSEAASQTGILIQNSINSVRRGTSLADETAQSLEKVVEMVTQVSRIVDGIAASAEEQADSVFRINAGMEMINGSIRDNSVTADKNAEVSRELSGQFETLNALINKFKFRKQ